MPVGNPSDPGAPPGFIPAEEPPANNPMANLSLDELTRMGILPPDVASAQAAAQAVAAAVAAPTGAPQPTPTQAAAATVGMVIPAGSSTPAPAPVPQMYVRVIGTWLISRMGAGPAVWWDLLRAGRLEFMEYPSEPWQGLCALVYVGMDQADGLLVGVWPSLDDALLALDAGTR